MLGANRQIKKSAKGDKVQFVDNDEEDEIVP